MVHNLGTNPQNCDLIRHFTWAPWRTDVHNDAQQHNSRSYDEVM